MKDEMQELITRCRAASDDVILMSRANCHAMNVSSIVVENKGGTLLRAFLAWPGHRLGKNNRLGGCLEVGIHDHRYDVSFKQIAGEVRNTNYHRSQEGVTLTEWRFVSGEMKAEPSVEQIGQSALDITNEQYLSDTWLHLPSCILHDIDCSQWAAWWVQEGVHRQTATSLFTSGDMVSLDGLYSKFATKNDVIHHVELFADTVEGKHSVFNVLRQDRLLTLGEWRDLPG